MSLETTNCRLQLHLPGANVLVIIFNLVSNGTPPANKEVTSCFDKNNTCQDTTNEQFSICIYNLQKSFRASIDWGFNKMTIWQAGLNILKNFHLPDFQNFAFFQYRFYMI